MLYFNLSWNYNLFLLEIITSSRVFIYSWKMETEDEFLDSFTERYRHCDFLYMKNNQYQMQALSRDF